MPGDSAGAHPALEARSLADDPDRNPQGGIRIMAVRASILAALLSGAVINALEWLFHGILLNRAWTQAFADLGVYPSDQPGRYQLNISSSLHRLRDSGWDLTHLCLRLTLERLHLNRPATGPKVVLSLPEWTYAAR